MIMREISDYNSWKPYINELETARSAMEAEIIAIDRQLERAYESASVLELEHEDDDD